MEPVDWKQLAAREAEIFNWLRDMGFDQHHRFAKHRENLEEILEAHARSL
jgi:hypothetical protein